MKTCTQCKVEKSIDEFYTRKESPDGLQCYCKTCHRALVHAYRKKNPQCYFKKLVNRKRLYCGKHGVPFDLTPEYLESIWTANCPVLNQPMVRGDMRDPMNTSLDRIDPLLGYTVGNVKFLSLIANRVKSNATPEILRAVLAYIEDDND